VVFSLYILVRKVCISQKAVSQNSQIKLEISNRDKKAKNRPKTVEKQNLSPHSAHLFVAGQKDEQNEV